MRRTRGARKKLLSAGNLQLSEDDNVLVQGVEGIAMRLGYFGFAYYEENAGLLRDLSIGGVEPSAETVNAGAYALARPLFIYLRMQGCWRASRRWQSTSTSI
jgi:phosphate transport system substrate-binding protein